MNCPFTARISETDSLHLPSQRHKSRLKGPIKQLLDTLFFHPLTTHTHILSLRRLRTPLCASSSNRKASFDNQTSGCLPPLQQRAKQGPSTLSPLNRQEAMVQPMHVSSSLNLSHQQRFSTSSIQASCRPMTSSKVLRRILPIPASNVRFRRCIHPHSLH